MSQKHNGESFKRHSTLTKPYINISCGVWEFSIFSQKYCRCYGNQKPCKMIKKLILGNLPSKKCFRHYFSDGLRYFKVQKGILETGITVLRYNYLSLTLFFLFFLQTTCPHAFAKTNGNVKCKDGIFKINPCKNGFRRFWRFVL